jgi:hypothetical protein
LKFNPDKTYLFVTVIKIDDAQYASTGKMGLFAVETCVGADGILLSDGGGDEGSLL